jgi:hypothetical protein
MNTCRNHKCCTLPRPHGKHVHVWLVVAGSKRESDTLGLFAMERGARFMWTQHVFQHVGVIGYRNSKRKNGGPMNAMHCLIFVHRSSFWLLVRCRRAFRQQIAKIVDENNKVIKHSFRESRYTPSRTKFGRGAIVVILCFTSSLDWLEPTSGANTSSYFSETSSYTVSWT